MPKFTITLVDAGMVAQLTDEESSTFIGLLAAVGEGNGRSAAEFALRFSIENHMTGKEQDFFKKEMEALFAERCQGYGTQVDVGHVLRGVLGLIRDHQVRIDSNYATLVVNVLCIESLARRVCPSYNLLDAAKPMLETYRKLCFDEDGVTPKKNQKLIKRAKSLMPLMYSKKDRADVAFFKKIAAERGPLRLAASRSSN
jgi:predicted unusual protein kinase regulating ubiquinone biosynthesis (AarF/ABC1/UbiB family)